MTAPAPKQWGLQPPLSVDLPQQIDNDKTAELIEELKRENNYEGEEAMRQRMKTLGFLARVTSEFVRSVSQSRHVPKAQIDQLGGKIYPYGSYRLGVYGPGSDIDTLAVAPRNICREDFFEFFPGVLRRMAEPGALQSLVPVPDAYVPIIKLVLNKIEIDLIFVSVASLQTIPKDLVLDNNKILDGLDERSIKSITGPRVTDQILSLIPEPKTFRTALRAIKLWAQRRAIYANIVGYPGGVAWAMLVAKVCQLYPHAVGATLIHKFFYIYKDWKWPIPVMLKEIETGREKTWNPVIYNGDKKNLMPIITPAYPSMCATYNMTKSGKTVIIREFARGAEIVDKIFHANGKWSDLFEKHTFFTKDFKYYLSVIASAETAEAAKAFSGLVESKVRILVQELERIADQINLARPFTKGFNRVHRCATEAEKIEVRKGSMKYKIDEVKTVESHNPDLVANGGGAAVLEDMDLNPREANYFTYTFYIGIDLTAAATKNLNISGPISNFKEVCKVWPDFRPELHFLDVQAVKCWDLPDDMFTGNDKKPVRPLKKVVKPKPGAQPPSQSESQAKMTRNINEVDGTAINGTEPKRQKLEHTPTTTTTAPV